MLNLFINIDRQTWVLLVTATVGITACSLYLRHARSARPKDAIPHVPYKYPFIGSTLEYHKDPVQFTKKWTERYGPTFRFHFNGSSVLVVGGPMVQEIFNNPDMSFQESNKILFDIGLFIRKDKSFEFPPSAYRDMILKGMTSQFNNYAERIREECTCVLDQAVGNQPVTIAGCYRLARSLVTRVGAAVIGSKCILSNPQFMEAFEMTADNGLTDILWAMPIRVLFPKWAHTLYKKFAYPRFNSVRRRHMAMVKALGPVIEMRRLHPENYEDIMQFMISNYLMGLDHETVVLTIANWLLVMAFLNNLTTTLALTSIIGLLARHPEWQLELRKEIEDVKGDPKLMVKLDSLIREALRSDGQNIGLPHTHVGKKPIVLSNGVTIMPGDEVYINARFNHGSNTVEDPFCHVEQKDKTATKVSTEFLPFGLGKHACPGRWFAVQSIKVILSNLLTRAFLIAGHPL
ncbi:cytochrome P450 [Dichotomocladium elegans]|nr:cytochrome P450 [Dichotomocladium elegans]